MVILKKLYSDTGLFDKVEFRMGINVIKGIYTKSPEEIRELNGIGKSTLIRLVDFALLSEEGKKYFSVRTYGFLKGHSVILEFVDEDISYFIRREFNNPNKARFGKTIEALDEYATSELRVILGSIFLGKDNYKGYFENSWFRSLIKFFIKDDINHSVRKDPLKFASSHISNFEAYVYNFFLLGLPNKSVNDYSVLKKKIDDSRKMKSRVTARIVEETGKKIEEISSEIAVLDKKIKVFQDSLAEYKFLKSYEGIEREIISISNEISSLLSRLTPVQRRLNEYRKSYEFEIEIDSNKASRLYSEVRTVFGEAVKKQLDDVIQFRKKLAENRKKFLIGKETELSTEIEAITGKISELEHKRSAFYKILDEKQALDSIKNTYQLLVEEKTKKERLAGSIESINKIDKELYRQNTLISESVSNMAENMNSVQEQLKSISSTFSEIVRESIHVDDVHDVVFDIRPRPNISSPLRISIEVPKSASLGKQKLKVLAYDLTVFFNLIENERKLPHFLVHDGVFHGIDIKTVVRVLNLANSMYLKNHNFQYIITANEKELDIPEDKKEIYGQYDFDLSETIVAKYKDIAEEMIFKREY